MRRGHFIAMLALLVAIGAAIFAAASYFSRERELDFDDFEEEDFEYFATAMDEPEPMLDESEFDDTHPQEH